MSPEVVSLDEMPDAAPGDDGGSEVEGKVPCPECGDYFKSRGLTRHLTSAHGYAPKERASTSGSGKKTGELALRWAEFQRGAALFVSFACSQCAAVLVEDAAVDGEAIAVFCVNRPKLRKQIESALASMDVMILVGTLAGTAQKMAAHHSIGKRLGLPGSEHQHIGQQSAAEKMMDFMSTMPRDARQTLLDQVFDARAAASANATVDQAQQPTVVVTLDDEAPGSEPAPAPEHVTENDRYQMAVAHSGSDFSTTQ